MGELERLRKEVEALKERHAAEVSHFENRINVLKKSEKMERKKSRISMQIDEDIVSKQIRKEMHDKEDKMEREWIAKQKAQSVEYKELQILHAKELQKFDYKMRQTQQLHTLEVNNIRSTHKFETEQLQQQIRALTGSLERESQKDRKIQELTEENEQLKNDKEQTSKNYDVVIEKLNIESEEAIKREINKRIKEIAQKKREINDLQLKQKRMENKMDRLNVEIKQLKEENEQLKNDK